MRTLSERFIIKVNLWMLFRHPALNLSYCLFSLLERRASPDALRANQETRFF